MPVKTVSFSKLKKKMDARGGKALDILVRKAGTVYVLAVTRDKCPSCEKQKPLFEKLSGKMKDKYAAQVEFLRVRSSYNPEEPKQCLDAFQTIGFPTYIIAVKNGSNNCETYRSLEPPMSEIERNTKSGVRLVSWLKSRKGMKVTVA